MLVEKAIWNAIFRIADRSVEPSLIMEELYNAIPWQIVDSCSDAEKKWFQLQKPHAKVTIRIPPLPLGQPHLVPSPSPASSHEIHAKPRTPSQPEASPPLPIPSPTALPHPIELANINAASPSDELEVENQAPSPPSPLLLPLSSLEAWRLSTKSPSPFLSEPSLSQPPQLSPNRLGALPTSNGGNARIIRPPSFVSTPSSLSTLSDSMDDEPTTSQGDTGGHVSEHDMLVDSEPAKRSSLRLQGIANKALLSNRPKTASQPPAPKLPSSSQKSRTQNKRITVNQSKTVDDAPTGGKRKLSPTAEAETLDKPKIKRAALTPFPSSVPIGGEDRENAIDVDGYCLLPAGTRAVRLFFEVKVIKSIVLEPNG